MFNILRAGNRRRQAGIAFEPTTAQQVEVGLKYQPVGSESFVGVSVFDLKRQNILATVSFNPFTQEQICEARVRGLEVEAKYQVTPNFDVIGAYIYLDPEHLPPLLPHW